MEALLFSSSPSKPFVQMFAGLGNAVEKKHDIVANATKKTGSSVPFEKGDLCHERDGVGSMLLFISGKIEVNVQVAALMCRKNHVVSIDEPTLTCDCFGF